MPLLSILTFFVICILALLLTFRKCPRCGRRTFIQLRYQNRPVCRSCGYENSW